MITVKIDKHQLNNNETTFELKDINIEIKKNGFYALVGKSGSGKTSILNLIYGLGKIQEGSLNYDDQLKHDDFEYITVDNNIFYDLTVIENLNLYERSEGKLNALLNRLQISNLKQKKCFKLSKGEQQRVAIARAVLSSKKVILIDEPTANLNTELAEVVFQIFNEISKDKTIIIATHEKKYVQSFADQMIELENGKLVSNKEMHPVNRTIEFDTTSYQNNFKCFLLILKLYFMKLFKKPTTFIFSFIFLLLTFLSIFVYDAITKIDEERSLISSFENLPYAYYKVHLGDSYGSLDGSYLQMLQFRTLQSIDISVTFDNEDTLKVTNKKIENYTINRNLYPDTLNIKYYPIIANEKLLDLIMNETGSLVSIGDVFPSGFLSTYPVEIKFIVVDTFKADKFEENNNLLFPSIISKDAYLVYIDETGIEDYTIGKSFANYTENYNSYLTAHPDKELYTGVFRYSEYLRLVTSQMVSNDFINMAEVDVTTGYYYYGQFPQEKNEVMISDIYLFNLLNDDVTKDAVEQAYLDLNAFKVEEALTYFNSNFGLEDIKIVGFFSYFDQSVQIHYGQMIISDLLFDEIKDQIINNNQLTESNSNDVIISKNQLLDNLEAVFEQKIVLGVNHYDNFKFAYNNSIQFKNFLSVLIVFVFVISFIFMYIYIKNYQKETFSDDLRFVFMGMKKSKVMAYHIIVVSIFMIIPAILVGILSNSILNTVMNMFTRSNQLLNLVITGISPVVSLLIPFGAFLLLIVIEVFLMTKNKMLEYIRYE